MEARDLADAARLRGQNPTLRVVQSYMTPGGAALDVHAGAGRFTVSLARDAARLVAVEPDAALAAELRAELAQHQLGHVEVREEAWPGAARPVDDFEVALCADRLHTVPDLDPFLAALERVSVRAVVLECAAGPPGAYLDPLRLRLGLDAAVGSGWERVRDAARGLGFAVQHELWERRPLVSYGSPGEAVAAAVRALGVPGREAEVEEAVRELGAEVEGRFYPLAELEKLVTLWWDDRD